MLKFCHGYVKGMLHIHDREFFPESEQCLNSYDRFSSQNQPPPWVGWSKKKNMPQILTKLTKVVDFELKTHLTKFCVPSSKDGGAVGPQSSVISEKNVFFMYTS